MTSISSLSTGLTATVIGIVAHLVYFNKGEHHRHGTKYLQAVFAGVLIASTTHQYATSATWITSVGACFYTLSYFFAGIYGSLLVYRLLLHPLNQFPGPLTARTSDIQLSMRLARYHDLHKQTVDLYKAYGPFVRIGSSTLMLAHPLAVPAIHGPDSLCHRASMYDFEQPNCGIATRDKQVHASRRRLWSHGFGERALRDYEDRIGIYVQIFLAHLSKSRGQPVDMAQWTEHFAFDVLGDLALGKDFGMLRDGGHPAIEQLVAGMEIMALRLPMWLLRLMVDVAQPLVPTEESTGFLAFCHANLDKMMNNEKRFRRPSLMAPLLAHYEKLPPSQRDISVLRNDCRFAIIAGSDTVAATLAFIFFYIARHQEHGRKVRDELHSLKRAHGNQEGPLFDHRSIMNAHHLNAVINETLRLHPPASTNMRVTPPEGLMVGDTFIPGNMTVFSSQYVIGRSEAVYEKAEDFVPERWYSKPEMIRERAGYAPFSTGHHSCLGRPLALMEMRLLVAECLSRYDVSFATGFDQARFLDTVEDCMSWRLGQLNLCFTNIEGV